MGFRYALRKDKESDKEREIKKYSELKSNIIYYLKELKGSIKNQKSFLEIFNKQLKENKSYIDPAREESHFNINDFEGIANTDVCKIFIEFSKQSIEEKSKGLREYNLL